MKVNNFRQKYKSYASIVKENETCKNNEQNEGKKEHYNKEEQKISQIEEQKIKLNDELLLLLKRINQQLIVMQKFIVTVCSSFNKEIDEEEKIK